VCTETCRCRDGMTVCNKPGAFFGFNKEELSENARYGPFEYQLMVC
jgi:hypothetical protein